MLLFFTLFFCYAYGKKQVYPCIGQKKITTLLPGGKSVACCKYKSFCSKTKFQANAKLLFTILPFHTKNE
jgi:hypothetical protein